MTGKKIVRKTYYRITFRLTSSLSIGSGEHLYTDRDIIRDASGKPYIPASAMAGVCRGMFLEDGDLPAQLKTYFGYVQINRSSDAKKIEQIEQIESALIFYDAKILQEDTKSYFTSVRDSAKLDSYKTAVEGAKFDMEILEPGVRFRTYLEQSFYDETDTDFAACIVNEMACGRAYFGGKNSRGYGKISVEQAERQTFDLTKSDDSDDSNDVGKWINFDLYDTSDKSNEKWNKYEIKTWLDADLHTLRLELEQKGGISIRKYTTQVSTKEETKPDYSQLTEHASKGDGQKNTEILPVIPGTSWAGAIRHRMHELGLSEQDEETLFGIVKVIEKEEDEKKKKEIIRQKSAIRFGESQIYGAKSKILSRNAIDRFSGGTVDSALFTEETYYGGTTELVISCDDAGRMSHQAADLLAAALSDLHYGFLAVGGETSIGRGLFEITAINGQALGESEKETAIFSVPYRSPAVNGRTPDELEKETIYPMLREAIRTLWA